MRDSMPGQAIEVFAAQPLLVPHLNRIRPASMQSAKETIEGGDEIAAVLVVARPKARELEHEHADFATDVLARFEKRCREQVSVEKILVRLACLRAETVQPGKLLDRDSVGDLQAKLEVRRHSIRQSLQILPARKIVIGGIHTNGPEHFGIFTEAAAVEPGFGHLAAIPVALSGVELAEPALVFPTGGTDKDALSGKSRRRSFHLFTVEGHANTGR